ncbi:Tll0287-like domain-containing protein [Tautonia rosea]|uniref:Tll0287-like domain-containing protein n=1 Tax=Tautonia rosea TaxID=2728037 RepID=UPI0014763BCD|nr:DUF3365 domain-containing protein [Tautonia rosea]
MITSLKFTGFFFLFVLLSGCGTPPSDPASDTPTSTTADPASDTFRQEARALTKSFAESLKAELSAAMTEGGPALAIPVCSDKAPALAADASANGLTIRRIGTRVRNTATNTPTDAERAVLERLTDQSPEFVGELDGSLTFMRAIFIQEAVCLNCHGSPDILHPEAPPLLAELYPDDTATGYALGDKRGAFVVKRSSPLPDPQ